ncbi:MBL fold metallo-hydrolase [Aestuariivirga litoralis]|uniref:MBL fold metallo-hydrolase n=1 Tax=Aestuariivirga litoralis TaxID=2650924 RepID=UPI0018C81B77|nr:MBL fold metallo-hydrolase [Aestuariivirga litoralis]MBG1231017.1 MBL fold metallo-hydrolase [Aestuariivirga litoralis]
MAKLQILIVPVTPFQQNASIVFDDETKQGAVVDPGGDLDRIEDAIKQSGAKIEKILLTHGHIDHAGGAADLAAKLKVPVIGPHEADKPVLDNIPNRAAQFGMADAKSVTPDQWLNEGDVVKVGGLSFSVLHAPGHSPGSVVLFNAENKFALMGDVLFEGSVGRTDLPGGSHETLINAIKTKILPLGDDVQFLPGHGNPSDIGRERQTNPYLLEK